MKLKLNLTTEEFNALPAHVKALIAHLSGTTYEMDTTGVEDVSALKNAKTHEVAERKKAEAKVKDLEATNTTLTETATKYEELLKNNVPKENYTALEKSYQDKLAAATKAHTDEAAKLKGTLNNLLIDGVAKDIANRVSSVPALMADVFAKRLTVDTDESGNFVTRVLKDGKVSALTLEDLEKEVVAIKEFAPIIKATKAGGSGAPNTKTGGGASGSGSGDKVTNMSKLSPADLVAQLEQTGAVVES